jgi:hypothetical protein
VAGVRTFVGANSFWKCKTTMWQAFELLLGPIVFWKCKTTMWQALERYLHLYLGDNLQNIWR